MTSEGPKEKAPIFLCVKVGKLTKKKDSHSEGPRLDVGHQQHPGHGVNSYFCSAGFLLGCVPSFCPQGNSPTPSEKKWKAIAVVSFYEASPRSREERKKRERASVFVVNVSLLLEYTLVNHGGPKIGCFFVSFLFLPSFVPERRSFKSPKRKRPVGSASNFFFWFSLADRSQSVAFSFGRNETERVRSFFSKTRPDDNATNKQKTRWRLAKSANFDSRKIKKKKEKKSRHRRPSRSTGEN